MTVQARAAELRRLYGHLDGLALLTALREEFPAGLAAVSSFGAEAVVLLDLVARVDPALPVIFLDTGELFDETLAHQRTVAAALGLTGLRIVRPNADELAEAEDLWRDDPDRCCYLRKVAPLERALAGFEALIDGRKRFHGGSREGLETIEAGASGMIKISPLARWSQTQIEEAFTERNLPRHPLVAQGYRSIGCWPCSRPIGPDEPIRAGRWAGAAKTECGIHRISKTDDK